MNKCEYCQHFRSEIISHLDRNNINTDLGVRILKCYELIDILKTNKKYGDIKYKGPDGNIGIIKKFEYYGPYKSLIPSTISKIVIPDWCPIK